MQNLLFIFLLLFSLSWSTGQAQRFAPHVTVQANVGLVPTFLKDKVETLNLPLALEVRYVINSHFSVGAQWGFSRSRADRKVAAGSPVYTFTHHYQLWALRPTLHAALGRKGAFYGGMIIGYTDSRVDRVEKSANGQSPVPYKEWVMPGPRQGLLLSAFIGGAYRLTPRLALCGELGMGISLLSTGIRYRL